MAALHTSAMHKESKSKRELVVDSKDAGGKGAIVLMVCLGTETSTLL